MGATILEITSNFIKFGSILGSRRPPGSLPEGPGGRQKRRHENIRSRTEKPEHPGNFLVPTWAPKMDQKSMEKKTKFQNHIFRDCGVRRAPKRSSKMVPKSYGKWILFRMPSVSVLGTSRRRFLKDVPRENMVFKNRPKTIFLDF